MDGYPSTPLNLSDGTTMTQDGGGEIGRASCRERV